MKVCPKCGEHNHPANLRCGCGHEFSRVGPTPGGASSAAAPDEEETEPAAAASTLEDVLNELPARSLVTPLLIILNVLVFGGMVGSGVSAFDPSIESLLQWGANFGPRTLSGEWWRLLTSTFLHIGALHLAFNMYVLWDAGRVVERMVGHAGFTVLYFASGLLGSVASITWSPLVVSAGASGAVFGVYGALVGILLRQHTSIPMAPLKRLRNGAIVFLAYNFANSMGEEGIDVAAHIGGLVGGFLLGLILSQPPRRESLATRPRRTAAALAAGTVLVAVAIAAIPAHIAGAARAISEFDQVETEVLATVNATFERAARGELSDPEVATILEAEVLPVWGAARASLENLDLARAPERVQTPRDDYVRYAREREEEWTDLAAFMRAMTAFVEVESLAMGRFNETVDQARTGGLTDAEFAVIVESEVLAPWRVAVERLAGVDLSKLDQEAGSSREGIVRYARTRDAAWTTIVEAAREGDSAKFEKGNALMQEADEMVAALGDEEPDPASAEPMATAAEP